MPDATQQLGVDYSATGLRNILKSIDDLTAATMRAEKAFASMYKAAGGKGAKGGLLALAGPTSGTNVTTKGGTASVTQSSGKINIAVMVRVVGGGQLATSGGGSGRSNRVGVVGPRQRRASLVAALTSGKLSGDAYADTLDAFHRNEKRLKPSTTKSRIMQAVMSTRINAGNASPLVGRSLSAMGVEAESAAGPLIIVGAAIMTAKALYDLTKAAADAGAAFNRTSLELGSGPGASARLMAIGAAVGSNGSSLANSIQSNITGGGMGTAAGLRLGVYNIGGYFGNQDYGQQALTVIQNLRKVSDPKERLRLARAVGGSDAPALMQAASLTGKDANLIDSTGATTAHVMDSQMQADAVAFQSASAMMAQSFSNLVAAAGQGEMERLTSAFRGVTNLLNMAADWVKNNKATIDMLSGIAEHVIIGAWGDIARAADNGKSTDANTRATEENTRAILQPGVYGRIERGGYAPPGIFNGQQMQQGRDMASRKLSSY